MTAEHPLLVLLLPEPLEAFPHRGHAEQLLRAPGAVAVEPGRVSYGALSSLPSAFGDRLAHGQARRLRLPGVPRAIVVYHAHQYPLARALIARNPGAQLWYAGRDEDADALGQRRRLRFLELHARATARAAFTFDPSADDEALLDRVAALDL